MSQTEYAVQIFKSAVAAVRPAQLLREHLVVTEDAILICGHNIAKHSIHDLYIAGAGKAAAAMAVETEKILGDLITGGLVTTKYHHSLDSNKIKITEAAHPVPDENCVKAVNDTLRLLHKAKKNDVVICLISGGASALWCDIPQQATLEEVKTVFDLLIKSGAAIDEVNTVRKHLSGIKGGQLIRHCGGARVFSLIISDVPGDSLDVIASGPTVADLSTFHDANAILLKYKLFSQLPENIRQHIEKGIQGIIAETPKPDEPLFNNTFNKIIGNNKMALIAAEKQAKALGYHTIILSELITGDAETAAKNLVEMAAAYKGEKPACLIQGGETTVKVTGTGKGGRNQHFVLAALNELDKIKNKNNLSNQITVLSGGTDGTDGPTDVAGAVADNETINKALQQNLSVNDYLKNHNSYHFFKQTGSLLITGSTQTNVMDVMMAIVT